MNTLIIEILVTIGLEIQLSMEDSYIDADGEYIHRQTADTQPNFDQHQHLLHAMT